MNSKLYWIVLLSLSLNVSGCSSSNNRSPNDPLIHAEAGQIQDTQTASPGTPSSDSPNPLPTVALNIQSPLNSHPPIRIPTDAQSPLIILSRIPVEQLVAVECSAQPSRIRVRTGRSGEQNTEFMTLPELCSQFETLRDHPETFFVGTYEAEGRPIETRSHALSGVSGVFITSSQQVIAFETLTQRRRSQIQEGHEQFQASDLTHEVYFNQVRYDRINAELFAAECDEPNGAQIRFRDLGIMTTRTQAVSHALCERVRERIQEHVPVPAPQGVLAELIIGQDRQVFGLDRSAYENTLFLENR